MKFQFKDKEFQSMMYSPAKLAEGLPFGKTFPDLKRYKIFLKSAGPEIDNEALMAYVFCMYDRHTPYRLKYPDVTKRKMEVAKDVGFPLDKETGKFTSPYEDIMLGKNSTANQKITEFIRIHRSFTYAYFVSVEASYYSHITSVMGGDAKKAVKNMPEIKAMGQELEQTLTDMMNEDDNPRIKEEILRYVEEERLMLRPEDIAAKIANNEQPISAKEIQ